MGGIYLLDHGKCFEEILCADRGDYHDDHWVAVTVAYDVTPKQCGPLLKLLSHHLPLKKLDEVDLTHLRRVRRLKLSPNCLESYEQGQDQPDSSISAEFKRQRQNSVRHAIMDSKTLRGELQSVQDSTVKKENECAISNAQEVVLEVILCTTSQWQSYRADEKNLLLETLQLSECKLLERLVPGRPAKSKIELEIFNGKNSEVNWWPTLYFHTSTREHQLDLLKLDDVELKRMEWGMQQCLQDAALGERFGCIVVCPTTNQVVARASDEMRAQSNDCNPLQTCEILAIQAVSRLERQAALKLTHLDVADALKQGQYLCTGLEVYTILEPLTFEAMALLHSRVSRVIFGIARPQGGGLTQHSIHDLPGTNHTYRAFQAKVGSSLFEECHVVQKAFAQSKET